MKFINKIYLNTFFTILVISIIFIISFTVNAGIEDEVYMTKLMRALWGNKDLEVIKQMTENNDYVYEPTENGINSLMYAAAGNQDPEVIKWLLEKEERLIERESYYGFNALMYALKYNSNFEVIKVVINEMDEDLKTADLRLMHAAASNKNLKVIKKLVEAGSDVTASTARGLSVLMCAAIGNENPEVIQYLINKGASVHARTNSGISVLMYAAGGNNNPNIISVLLDAGANLNSSNKIGYNALYYALASAENSKKKIVEILVKNDIKINQEHKYQDGFTTFMSSFVIDLDSEILELLIDSGGDLNSKDDYGRNPLHIAAVFKNKEGVNLLIKNGVDVNSKAKDELTPLHFAVTRNLVFRPDINPKIVQLLIDAGAEVNAVTEDGETPLVTALSNNVEKNNINLDKLRKIVEILINAGANVNQGLDLVLRTGPKGVEHIVRSPLIWAVDCTQDPEIVRILIDAGANINKTGVVNDTPGRTALHQAVSKENFELVKILVDARADLNIKGREGKTPLIMAAQYNTITEIIEYLLDAGADGSIKYNGKTAFYYYEKNENLENDTITYWRLNDVQY